MAAENGTKGRIVTKEAEPKALTKAERQRLSGLQEIVDVQREFLADAQREEIEGARALAEARRAQLAAYERVDALAPALTASRERLSDAIAEANDALEFKDQVHDGVGAASGVAGLVAATILSGGWALVVGGVLLGVSKTNSVLRQAKKGEADDNPAAEAAGNLNDGAGLVDDFADYAGSPLASRTLVGIGGGAAGLVGAVYEAQTTTSSPIEARIGSAEELRGLPSTVDRFTQTYENISGFDGQKIKDLAKETLELQEAYDDAVEDAVAADKAAGGAESTWSDASGRAQGRAQMLEKAKQQEAALRTGPLSPPPSP